MAYVILEKATGDACGDNRIGLPFRWSVKESDFEIPLPNQEVVGLQFATPIPITQDDINNFPNEFRIERTGSCNKCGYCCGWIQNKATAYCCIHIIKTGNKRGECGIYANLADVCIDANCDNQDLNGSHLSCQPSPHQPYHKLNENCGYSWIVTTPGLPISNKEVIRMYWASDKNLMGKWIRE